MRIPTRPPDAARMARAQAELGRIEARLKRDALKADVIARIVSDTAKNKDVLDRPAVFAALTQDPDSMMELARQAGWLAEEPPVTGTELRRAGTLLGSLLNAFEVPKEREDLISPEQSRHRDFGTPQRSQQLIGLLGQNIGGLADAGIDTAVQPATVISVADPMMPSHSALSEEVRGVALPPPVAVPIQSLKTVSLGFLVVIGLAGIVLLGWLNL